LGFSGKKHASGTSKLARQASIERGVNDEGFATIQSKPDAQVRECNRYAMGAGCTTTFGWRTPACVGHSKPRSPSLARQASIERRVTDEGFATIQSKPDAQARECNRDAMGAGSTTKTGWRDAAQGEQRHATSAGEERRVDRIGD